MSLPPFQVLIDSHGAVVHRFLVASVGPVDADDCFQEVWIAALRGYPELRNGDNLRGWLLKIAQPTVPRRATSDSRIQPTSPFSSSGASTESQPP